MQDGPETLRQQRPALTTMHTECTMAETTITTNDDDRKAWVYPDARVTGFVVEKDRISASIGVVNVGVGRNLFVTVHLPPEECAKLNLGDEYEVIIRKREA